MSEEQEKDPTFEEVCAHVFKQIGQVPAELYFRRLSQLVRDPDANIADCIEVVLDEAREGITSAVEEMKKKDSGIVIASADSLPPGGPK